MAAPDWLVSRPIAHRGYHDLTAGRAENSIGAFRAAIEAGFAIECDVQVTATGEPVVFHDPVLGRMTGVEGTVGSKTPDKLATLALADTSDTIATLKQHLDLVAGKVPIIIELKGVEGEDAGFVEGVADALSGYDGPAAVMSFDHWICAQFATLMPHVSRGLTAEGADDCADIHQKAMRDFDLRFVSYHVDALPNVFVQRMREAGLPVITWTVRNAAQRQLTRRFADQMTFEGFDPRQVDPANDS
ncbi:MAG: glycerophosphodiester phosphodiesterase family protein [Ahrensia sp.]|nr:glycerophosphodiester phosphodiesterase family protein [Ahrensia sp.]